MLKRLIRLGSSTKFGCRRQSSAAIAINVDPPLFSNRVWSPHSGHSFAMYNQDIYSYFFQIKHDLIRYYRKSAIEADELLLQWSYLNERQSVVELIADKLTVQSPWYYATRMALAPSTKGWVKIASSEPRGYVLCKEYVMLSEGTGLMTGDAVRRKYSTQLLRCQLDNGSVYHGSLLCNVDSIANGINLELCANKTDFAVGEDKGVFYVTNDKAQAGLWALKMASDNNQSETPEVVSFKMDIGKLRKEFDWKVIDTYDEWCDYVSKGRMGKGDHNHDAVEGPYLVNPKSVTKSDTEPRSHGPLVPDGHQIALCKDGILSELLYVGSCSVDDVIVKAWIQERNV